MITWIDDLDAGVTYSDDGRFDILKGPDGYMLRENQGDEQSPDWAEVDTYDTLSEAQAAAAGDDSPAAYSPAAYSPHSGDPDGFQVTSDAEGGL
jgi:hypothetical protein